jgi:hypothetical protein
MSAKLRGLRRRAGGGHLEQAHRARARRVGLGVPGDRAGRVTGAVDALQRRLRFEGRLQLGAVLRVAALGQHPGHQLPEEEGVLVVVGGVVVRDLAVLRLVVLGEHLSPGVARVIGVEVVVGELVAEDRTARQRGAGGEEVGADDGRRQVGREVGLHKRRRVGAPGEGQDDVGVGPGQLGHGRAEVVGAAPADLGVLLGDDLGRREVVLHRLQQHAGEVPGQRAEVRAGQGDLGLVRRLGRQVLHHPAVAVGRGDRPGAPDVRQPLEDRQVTAARVGGEDLVLDGRLDEVALVEEAAGDAVGGVSLPPGGHGGGPRRAGGGEVLDAHTEVGPAGCRDVLQRQVDPLEAGLTVGRLGGTEQQAGRERVVQAGSRVRSAEVLLHERRNVVVEVGCQLGLGNFPGRRLRAAGREAYDGRAGRGEPHEVPSPDHSVGSAAQDALLARSHMRIPPWSRSRDNAARFGRVVSDRARPESVRQGGTPGA